MTQMGDSCHNTLKNEKPKFKKGLNELCQWSSYCDKLFSMFLQ